MPLYFRGLYWPRLELVTTVFRCYGVSLRDNCPPSRRKKTLRPEDRRVHVARGALIYDGHSGVCSETKSKHHISKRQCVTMRVGRVPGLLFRREKLG